MTQVSVTLTEGQGHQSRSNVQKLAQNDTIGHISNAILPTDFILGTKVHPNKGQFMIQVLVTLTEVKCPKIGQN